MPDDVLPPDPKAVSSNLTWGATELRVEFIEVNDDSAPRGFELCSANSCSGHWISTTSIKASESASVAEIAKVWEPFEVSVHHSMSRHCGILAASQSSSRREAQQNRCETRGQLYV